MEKILTFLTCVYSAVTLSAQTCNMPYVDLSSQKERQFVIAEGKEDLYNGHPTTVLMEDGKNMVYMVVGTRRKCFIYSKE